MSILPEISFADTSPDEVRADILAAVASNLGRTLYPGDPLRLFAMAFAAQDIHIRNLLDEAGRQNLLAYATGPHLDALGDLINVRRLEAVGASTTLRFTTSQPAVAPITIPKGSQATPGESVYFETDYAGTIQTGQTYVDVQATCTTTGTSGNGWETGEISQLVQAIGYIASVTNTSPSAGGTDIEADGAYRERIRLGINRFSVAGSRDAYEYWARTASAQIADVYVTSPNPGEVDVYILLQNGELPGAELLESVEATLSADDIRPLTDLVTAKEPTTQEYAIELEYWLRRDDAARSSEIQSAVEQAIDDWILWQRSAIGRDINPSELIARCINAGAKRLAITSPAFTSLDDTAIAVLAGDPTITYGGLEDD